MNAGGVCIKEPSRLSANGRKTRPDLQLVLNGQYYLIDVTIRHPTCPTYYDCKEGSSEVQLASTAIAEKQKIGKYSTMAKDQHASFLPFAVESYGGLGKSAKQVIQLIQQSATDQMLMWPYQQIVENLKAEIAISIQRGNAVAMQAMQAGYNRSIGRPARLHRGGCAVAA
jgi:hypothetical protein